MWIASAPSFVDTLLLLFHGGSEAVSFRLPGRFTVLLDSAGELETGAAVSGEVWLASHSCIALAERAPHDPVERGTGDHQHGLALVVLIALGAVSVLLAHAALRPTEEDLQAPPPGTPVWPARHGALIMNLRSGGGKAERFDLVGECRRRGIEPIVLEPGLDLLELARGAIARGADVIGMAGGDGSQALVASVAMQADVPLVCIPAGTRNRFDPNSQDGNPRLYACLTMYGNALAMPIPDVDRCDFLLVIGANPAVSHGSPSGHWCGLTTSVPPASRRPLAQPKSSHTVR